MAIYARYSSDLQRPASIDDQIRQCSEVSARKGWEIARDYIRCDQAKSGRTLLGRDSLEELVRLAESKPRPFDAIIDDTSRFGRKCERLALVRSTLKSTPHVQIAEFTDQFDALDLFVREHKLEDIVAERADSRHEPGKRTGSWTKLRYNCRQEFVVGGFTPSDLGLDALLVGIHKGKSLHFAGAVRGGFNPQMRRVVHNQIKELENRSVHSRISRTGGRVHGGRESLLRR